MLSIDLIPRHDGEALRKLARWWCHSGIKIGQTTDVFALLVKIKIFLNEHEIKRLPCILTSFSWCISRDVLSALVEQVC